jgi:hypothetical protein
MFHTKNLIIFFNKNYDSIIFILLLNDKYHTFKYNFTNRMNDDIKQIILKQSNK